MKDVPLSSKREWVILGVGLIWALTYVAALALLQTLQLDRWVRALVALLPVLPFVFFLLFVISQIRKLDELHRRVHLEALAVAFPLTILLLMILGLLDQAIGLAPGQWSYRQVWYYLPFFYFLGLALAWRRYQ